MEKKMVHHKLTHKEEVKGGKDSHAKPAKVVKKVHKQTAKDKLDESLGMRRGKESTKTQAYSSRRHESKAMKGK